MFSTCCINGRPLATQTPIPYKVEETIENGQDSYTGWMLKGATTIDFFYPADQLGIVELNTQGGRNPDIEFFSANTKGKSVLKKIESRILDNNRFPSHWAEEGIARPSMACKLKANEICKHLFDVYELIPDRIAPSKEEGVFIAFDSFSGSKSLFIEVYNDLEAGYLLNDNVEKRIIASDNITDFEFDDIIQLIND